MNKFSLRHFPFLLILFLTACNNKPATENNINQTVDSLKIDSSAVTANDSLMADDEVDDSVFNYQIYYVVVADTGYDYFKLDDKMYKLSKQLKIPVDTMGRHFNRKKNLIALADDDEDEMYAGEYYPRRDASDNLSLEYLGVYQPEAEEKTIALVAGIYETQKSADSALAILKRAEKNSFGVKANVYVGCMH